jgi:hypothetical protein
MKPASAALILILSSINVEAAVPNVPSKPACTIPLPHLMEGGPGELVGRIGTVAARDFTVYSKPELKSSVVTRIKKGEKIKEDPSIYTVYLQLSTVRVKKDYSPLKLKKGDTLSQMGFLDDVSAQYCKENKLIEIDQDLHSEILDENEIGQQKIEMWIKLKTLNGTTGFVYGPRWNDGLDMFRE